MTKPIVFMFSGQGSHYYQMGRDLFDKQQVFRYWVQSADEIFQALTGLSFINELYHKSYQKCYPFTRTLFTHPAIFSIEYALGQLLYSQGMKPDYVLGASLGEFTAAVFAKIISFETALSSIIKQAQIIEDNCLPGQMLAILQSAYLYKIDSFIQKQSELAATNFDSHFVVSGEPDRLTRLATYLDCQKIVSQKLMVAHGFHSSCIDTAAVPYAQFAGHQSFSIPNISFISCTHAELLINIHPLHFWDAIRLPIQFQRTIQMLESKNNYFYFDLGPSGTLANFIKYNLTAHSSSETTALMTMSGQGLINLTKLGIL